jgi:hypothetical protein
VSGWRVRTPQKGLEGRPPSSAGDPPTVPDAKGWIKGYHILSNINPRDGEPDLYLVTIFDHQTTPAEDIQREKEMNAFMAQTTRQSAAGSGHRATYRKQKGDMLLQELVWSH